jgi:excinuclease ABC subunit A
MVLAPVVRRQKGEFKDLFEDLQKQGFVRARVDGRVVLLTEAQSLDRQMRHDIEVVIDRLVAGPAIRTRLAEAVELALKLGDGNLIIAMEVDEAAAPSLELLDEEDLVGGDAVGGVSDADALPVKPAAKRGKKKAAADEEDGDEEEAPEAVAPAARGRHKGHGQPGDITLSADYACNSCGISFQPPTPQLFSFNSPQGMCLSCDGLGEMFSFDPEKLVPDPSLSFATGAIELIGSWKDLGRWKRHIYAGVAETMDRKLSLGDNYLLETPWSKLSEEERRIWLWGTGSEHITYTWRNGKASQKYGGTFDGRHSGTARKVSFGEG